MKNLPTVALAGLLASCSASNSPTPAPAPPNGDPGPTQPTSTSTPDVDTSLARLQALQIFEVLGIPEQANCYGADSACLAREKALAAPRVATFTGTAVQAASLPPDAQAANASAVADNLQTLRNLNVVVIGDLIVEQPKNNPNCYFLPCPSDQQAADAVNAAREGQLGNITTALKP